MPTEILNAETAAHAILQSWIGTPEFNDHQIQDWVEEQTYKLPVHSMIRRGWAIGGLSILKQYGRILPIRERESRSERFAPRWYVWNGPPEQLLE